MLISVAMLLGALVGDLASCRELAHHSPYTVRPRSECGLRPQGSPTSHFSRREDVKTWLEENAIPWVLCVHPKLVSVHVSLQGLDRLSSELYYPGCSSSSLEEKFARLVKSEVDLRVKLFARGVSADDAEDLHCTGIVRGFYVDVER